MKWRYVLLFGIIIMSMHLIWSFLSESNFIHLFHFFFCLILNFKYIILFWINYFWNRKLIKNKIKIIEREINITFDEHFLNRMHIYTFFSNFNCLISFLDLLKSILYWSVEVKLYFKLEYLLFGYLFVCLFICFWVEKNIK